MLVGDTGGLGERVGGPSGRSYGILDGDHRDSAPSQITVGPEGDLWFTEESTYSGGRVVRMTPTGEVTEHEVLEYSEPRGIAVGPEGDLWFTEVNILNVTANALARSGGSTR